MEPRGARRVNLLGQLVRRPLSLLTALLGMALIIIPLYERSRGSLYIYALDYVDDTTLCPQPPAQAGAVPGFFIFV